MNKITETAIEADPKLPVLSGSTCDFAATPGNCSAPTRIPCRSLGGWVPTMTTRIEHGVARTGRQLAVRRGARWHGVRVPRLLPRGTAGPYRADLHLRGRSRRCCAGDVAVRGPGRRPYAAADAVAGRQLRGPRRVAAQRHGGRCRRGLRQAAGCSPMARTIRDRPAERHRQVAGLFTERVRGTRSWGCAIPGRPAARTKIEDGQLGMVPGRLDDPVRGDAEALVDVFLPVPVVEPGPG